MHCTSIPIDISMCPMPSSSFLSDFFKQQMNFENNDECYSKKFSDKLSRHSIPLCKRMVNWSFSLLLFSWVRNWVQPARRYVIYTNSVTNMRRPWRKRSCAACVHSTLRPWPYSTRTTRKVLFLRPALKIWLHTPSLILLANFYSLQL